MRIARIVLAGVLAVAAWDAAAAANEEELRALRARIEKLQRDVAAAEESRGEAVDQLKASEKAVSDAQRSLFMLSRERQSLEGDLATIAAREADLRQALARQQTLAARLLLLQYRQGAPDALRLALEGKDPASVARHFAYLGYIQRSRAGIITRLRTQQDELAKLEADGLARRGEIAANEAESAKQAKVLQAERATRAAVVARIAGDIAKGRREIGRLQRDEQRLTKLVEQIARALAAPPASPGGRRVDQVADASAASKPFESLRGKLRLPVRGDLMNHYGAPREESGATWKGLFIRSVSGETIHAVADGRVVYSDWLRGFGNLLILDHGKGYMSLYANNEALLAQVGERVRAGDPVARVGASGGLPESGLYFELRRDGKTFDPLKWVAP